jgi:hypothetical protein
MGAGCFGFPKRPDVERQLFLESEILPLLAPRTPVPIPSFAFRGVPSPRFPLHFVGYPKLAGVPGIVLKPTHIQFDQLAPVLGAFLTSLHSFPVQIAKQVGAPEYASEALLKGIRAEALGDLHMIGRVAVGIRENELRSFLEAGVDDGHLCRAATVVHGDLGAEHLCSIPKPTKSPALSTGAKLRLAIRRSISRACSTGEERNSRRRSWRTIMEGPTRGFWGEPGSSQPHEAWATSSSACGKQRPEYLNSGIRALRWCLNEFGV